MPVKQDKNKQGGQSGERPGSKKLKKRVRNRVWIKVYNTCRIRCRKSKQSTLTVKKKKEEAEIETTDITKIKEGWEECTKRKRRFRDSKSESFSANESVNIWILIILKF